MQNLRLPSLLLCSALFGACGGTPDSNTEDLVGGSESVGSMPQAFLGTIEGTVDVASGTVTLVENYDGSGLSTVGTIVKLSSKNVVSGDGKFSFDVVAKNNSADSVDWVYVNVTSLTIGVGLSNSDGYATGYGSITPQTYGGRSFGAIPASGTVTRNFEFAIPGGSFSFKAQVWGQVGVVNCAITAFGDWSTCSAMCGGGTQTATRNVILYPANGGTACPTLLREQTCNTQPCPIDCVLSPWSDWGACSALCDGGMQTKTRTIVTFPAHGGAPCGPLTEDQACNIEPCRDAS